MKIIPLDRGSNVPLHAQIELVLRRLSREPAYRNGKLLPGEVALAERLKVSRNTVRAAMSRLESEGLLERTPKVGTRFARSRPRTNLAEWYSFTREMRRQGIEVVNFELSLSRIPADSEAASALGIERGQEVWMLRRVRGWDKVPVVLAISWLHPSLRVRSDEDFNRPLYEVLRNASGVVPAMSREDISAIGADAAVAAALRVPRGKPILLRRRTIFDRKGRPIEYNRNYYLSDRHRLTLDLRGAGK